MRLWIAIAAATLTAAPAAAATADAAIRQLESDWAAALIKKDFATIERVLASNWSSQDDWPEPTTRDALIASFRSGDDVTKSIELGAMRIEVIGDVAIVQGSETVVSSYKGRDTSGRYNWTDAVRKRAGTWQVVFSQVTKVTH